MTDALSLISKIITMRVQPADELMVSFSPISGILKLLLMFAVMLKQLKAQKNPT